jgi:molecular chaperone Hsp33
MTRIANDNPIDQDGDVKDNIILPFQLQESGLRGRAIRLGSELNTIISAHDYPDAISHLLADTITLAVALSSMLKYDGIFTLQAS